MSTRSEYDNNIFVGYCLATKVLIDELLATKGIWIFILCRAIMKRDHGPIKQLQDIGSMNLMLVMGGTGNGS